MSVLEHVHHDHGDYEADEETGESGVEIRKKWPIHPDGLKNARDEAIEDDFKKKITKLFKIVRKPN